MIQFRIPIGQCLLKVLSKTALEANDELIKAPLISLASTAPSLPHPPRPCRRWRPADIIQGPEKAKPHPVVCPKVCTFLFPSLTDSGLDCRQRFLCREYRETRLLTQLRRPDCCLLFNYSDHTYPHHPPCLFSRWHLTMPHLSCTWT